MPSFDVVSDFDAHEASNAVDQANREVSTRFDFKDTDASFSLDDQVINLCEIKFHQEPFTITKAYADNLRSKMGVFRQATKTRKIWKTADQARVDQPGVFHARHVTGLGEHTVKIPDRLLRSREMLSQETATIFLGKEAVKAPVHFFNGANIKDFDNQEIAGCRAFDPNWAG